MIYRKSAADRLTLLQISFVSVLTLRGISFTLSFLGDFLDEEFKSITPFI